MHRNANTHFSFSTFFIPTFLFPQPLLLFDQSQNTPKKTTIRNLFSPFQHNTSGFSLAQTRTSSLNTRYLSVSSVQHYVPTHTTTAIGRNKQRNIQIFFFTVSFDYFPGVQFFFLLLFFLQQPERRFFLFFSFPLRFWSVTPESETATTQQHKNTTTLFLVIY